MEGIIPYSCYKCGICISGGGTSSYRDGNNRKEYGASPEAVSNGIGRINLERYLQQLKEEGIYECLGTDVIPNSSGGIAYLGGPGSSIGCQNSDEYTLYLPQFYRNYRVKLNGIYSKYSYSTERVTEGYIFPGDNSAWEQSFGNYIAAGYCVHKCYLAGYFKPNTQCAGAQSVKIWYGGSGIMNRPSDNPTDNLQQITCTYCPPCTEATTCTQASNETTVYHEPTYRCSEGTYAQEAQLKQCNGDTLQCRTCECETCEHQNLTEKTCSGDRLTLDKTIKSCDQNLTCPKSVCTRNCEEQGQADSRTYYSLATKTCANNTAGNTEPNIITVYDSLNKVYLRDDNGNSMCFAGCSDPCQSTARGGQSSWSFFAGRYANDNCGLSYTPTLRAITNYYGAEVTCQTDSCQDQCTARGFTPTDRISCPANQVPNLVNLSVPINGKTIICANGCRDNNPDAGWCTSVGTPTYGNQWQIKTRKTVLVSDYYQYQAGYPYPHG